MIKNCVKPPCILSESHEKYQYEALNFLFELSVKKRVATTGQISVLFLMIQTAVSHNPQSGDATTSPAGDAASSTGDLDVSAVGVHL